MSEGRLIKNKLRIVRQVGRGGMGFVYEAFHEGLRVTRALKQIVGDLQDNPEIERRFLHEAQMMARLEHPHIVRVFDIDQEPGFGTYLLMEFIRGRDLGDVLRQEGRFSYPETLRIGIAVASALDCAHRAGLVHRDIKPANILIEDGTGRPVVTDFGIAKEVESANENESFTRTGSFVGTYRYSSREQIRAEKGVPIDGRADVYSLGVVLYEIFAGKKYLAGMPELKIASCVGYQDDWLPTLDYPEPPPARFATLIDEAIAPDRDKRIRSAADLVARLEECRRLDLLGAGPAGGGAGVGLESTLAATSATTQTAPTPSQSSGMGELTSTTLDDPRPKDAQTETRSQWVALLQGLRGAVDDQAGEFERLLKELIELDIPRDDFRQLDDMSQILSRVERAESEGQYQDAASNLQGLSDRIQGLNGRIEQTIGGAIQRNLTELRQGFRDLAAGAGDLLPAERVRGFEQLLAPVAGMVEAGDWASCRDTLREARARLDEARGVAREAAQQRVAADLGALRAAYDALAARSADAARATGVEPRAVAQETAAAIEQGSYAAALRRAADAVRLLRDAAQREERAARDAAGAAREAASSARGALDLGEVQELARGALAEADQELAAADEALQSGDADAARRGFDQARARYAGIVAQVQQATREQVAAGEEEVRAAIAALRGAPDELAAAARAAAERVLAGERPRERRAALAALAAARDALASVASAVEPFRRARAAEADAQASLERATGLGATRDDLAPARQLLDEARAGMQRRAYGAAAEAFARAAAAGAAIGEQVVARGESERLAATRTQIDEQLGALDTTLAGEFCAADIERALRARQSVDAAERAGDRAAALAASGEALGALRDASQALLGGLGERSSALQADLAALATRAGDLLPAGERSELERGAQAVERGLVQRDAKRAGTALDEAWRRVGDTRVALDERTRALATDGLARIRAALAEAATLDPGASADVDAGALAARVDALLGEERFADARGAVTDAVARAGQALDAVRARVRGALASARDGAVAARREVDTDAAREVAAAELAEVEARQAQAEKAEKAGDVPAATRLFGEVAEAARALRAEVRTRQIARLEDERAALGEVLARAAEAAPEIVGKARDEARALVDATVAGDLRQAAAALVASRTRLDGLLAEAAQFTAAREQQELARAAEKRVGALSPSRRQLKGPAALQHDADAVFAKKTWPAAAGAYAKAVAAWGTLEGELQKALDAERAVAQAKADAAAAKQREREAVAAREREQALEAKRRAEEEQAARVAKQRAEAEAKSRADAEAKARAEEEKRGRAALEAKQREDAARAAKERAALERARGADRESDATMVGGAASATEPTRLFDADTTQIGPADATRIEPAETTRIEPVVPQAEARKGLPLPALAGGAALLVAAAGLALWLSQREPSRPPVTTAKVEEPKTVPPKVETKPEVREEPKQAVPPPAEEPVVAPEPQAPPQEAKPEPAPTAVVAPPEEPAQVAKVEPPAPVAPPPLRISGFTPGADTVTVKEGAKQAFTVDVAGGEAGKKPKIAWRLGDKVVANDVARWEYAPGFDAAGTATDAPRALEVVVGEGADVQKHGWQVAVANVNRKPTLVASPKTGAKIDAKLGDTVKLAATVKDEDGDQIQYAWKIDGKAVADTGPQLEVPVTGNRQVSVTASDGTAEASASWQIAAIKPVLKLDASPARLERLRFEKPQDFALSVPAGTSGLELEWTVNGKKVASGAKFTFANDDPANVRRTPVEIAVSGRDAAGATFEKQWEVVIEPPAPQVTSAEPPAGTIDAAPGSTQTFQLAAASPIGGQDLSYVFQVDGRQAAKGKSPSFDLRVGGDKQQRVTGFVQDNFDQVSSRTEWSIAPRSGSDIVRSAQSWLDDYQSAFNAKDAARLGQLRGLSSDKVAELGKVLADQEGLRVTFSNVNIEKLDDQRARITYTRSDDFTDARGTPVSRTGTVEQVVGMQGGRVVELETRRR